MRIFNPRLNAFLAIKELIAANERLRARPGATDTRPKRSSFTPVNTPRALYRLADKRRVLRRDKPQTRFVLIVCTESARGASWKNKRYASDARVTVDEPAGAQPRRRHDLHRYARSRRRFDAYRIFHKFLHRSSEAYSFARWNRALMQHGKIAETLQEYFIATLRHCCNSEMSTSSNTVIQC